MKKKIILLVAALMLFATGVSASSLNGDYKGNPIVKITSNGKDLEVDEVPPMIYDGHTVVPISLLRQIGASVTWDANTYSVDVKMNNNVTSNSSDSDIKFLKLYMKIANHYKRLALLGEMLHGVGDSYSLVFDATRLKNYDKTTLDTAFNRLNDRINKYNDFIKINEEMIMEASSMGVNTNDMRTILNSYNSSINFYKLSYEGIEGYYYNLSNDNFNKYLNNRKTADSLVNDALTKSDDGYFTYYAKTQM